jgi:hypothetical protein
MGLGEEKENNFGKVVAMLEGMLCDEYVNYKSTANVVISFFNSVDRSSFDYVIGFIDKIVKFRSKLEDKMFRKVIGAVFDVFGVKKLF